VSTLAFKERTIYSLAKSFKRMIRESDSEQRIEFCRKRVLASPNLNSSERLTERLQINLKTKRDLLSISILSYYLDEDLGFLIREEVRVLAANFSQEDQFVFDIILNGKVYCELWLLEQKLFDENGFFGNYLNETRIGFLLNQLYIVDDNKRPVTPKVFKRGYQDKGSLRPSTRWLESSDYLFNEEQEEIERSRKRYTDTLDFAFGYLSGVPSPLSELLKEEKR